MINQGVDNIVLGCTHYPFLIPIIRSMIPQEIAIIDSGEAVAIQTKKILNAKSLLSIEERLPLKKFFTNYNQKLFLSFLEQINLKADEVSFKSF